MIMVYYAKKTQRKTIQQKKQQKQVRTNKNNQAKYGKQQDNI